MSCRHDNPMQVGAFSCEQMRHYNILNSMALPTRMAGNRLEIGYSLAVFFEAKAGFVKNRCSLCSGNDEGSAKTPRIWRPKGLTDGEVWGRPDMRAHIDRCG